MKKVIKDILTFIALLLVIIEIFQLLAMLIPALSNISFHSIFENYTYLALYFVLALEALVNKGFYRANYSGMSRSIISYVISVTFGFSLIFIMLALSLIFGIIEVPYEGGLLIVLIYYLFSKNHKNRLYIGIFVAMVGIALTSYVSNILGQIVIITGLYLYLIKINPKFKLKRQVLE